MAIDKEEELTYLDDVIAGSFDMVTTTVKKLKNELDVEEVYMLTLYVDRLYEAMRRVEELDGE